MTRQAYGYILLLCTGLFSCTRELKLPDIKSPKKVVLLGELVANQPVYIRAGQSLPITASSNLTLALVPELNVTLKDRDGNNYALAGAEDSLSAMLATIPFTFNTLIKPSTNYTITTVHPTLANATAEVPIPAPFTATITDTSNVTEYVNQVIFKIKINDPATEDFYVIEVLKQRMNVDKIFLFNNVWLSVNTDRYIYDSLVNAGVSLQTKYDTVYYNAFRHHDVFTDDANTENLKNNSSFNSYKRILLSDFTFKGGTYTTRIFVNKELPDQDTSFKGRMIVTVKSVSKDYFQYLTAYENHQELVGLNNTSSISNFKSNVQNGLGIVGGVFKNEFIYLFDKWDF